MPAAAASLLLALSSLQGAASRGSALPAPPYPWVLEPVDLIVGHLTEGRFKQPSGVWFDPVARELFVADGKNGLIGIYDDRAVPLFAFGGPGVLTDPRTVRSDERGTIYVLDADPSALRVFSYRGESLEPLSFPWAAEEGDPSLPEEGAGPQTPPIAGVARISAFTRDAAGRWYVGDAEDPRVVVFGPDLRPLRELRVPSRRNPLQTITAIAVSPDGTIAVIDMRGPPVSLFSPDGRYRLSFGERQIGIENFTAPVAAAFDEEGFLFVVDLLRHDVKIYDPEGRFRSYFGGWFSPETAGRGPGEMLYPCDIAIDPDGNRVYVAERFGGRVQIFRRVRREANSPRPRLRMPAIGEGPARNH